ncbi:hypothetical protein K3495_g14043 [Podosphaera aphanis]|nr:hypothetical protein K3495_g14043 [Podosphaera aphanis]
MVKSQHPPPLAQRVVDELELVQRVAKGRATWVQNIHTKFWTSVEEADPLIKSFVREQMDAFLLAVASGHPMRHDTPIQPKPASSLPKPSQNLPSRPPLSKPSQPHNWAAIAARPPTSVPSASSQPVSNNRSPRTSLQKPTVIPKGPKAIFPLTEEAPLLRADATSVKAALIKIVPGLKDGIASLSRSSSGFSIMFSSEESLKLAMEHADSIKASLSGALHQVEDRIGYVVKRIPRTIWNPVSNLVSSTIDDVKNIAEAQTGVAPSSAHWSLHENRHDPFHTAVIFFPKEVPTFRIVDSAQSRRYIPNPKVVQCEACFGFHQSSRCRIQALCASCGTIRHQGECSHIRRCINCLGPHPADDLSCPLRPRPHKGKLIQPSDKEVMELRSSNRNLLRKTRRAEAATAAATVATSATSATTTTAATSATATTTITAPVSAQSPSLATGASISASQDIPPASLNRVSALVNASSQSMEIDSDEQAPNNALSLALHE